MHNQKIKISPQSYVAYVLGAFVIGAGLFFYQVYVNSGAALTVSVSNSESNQQNQPAQALSLIVVRTDADQERGLGGRMSLPVDQGMLFVFDHPSNYGIWMKDMHFPIDIISLDTNFVIAHIESNVATSTYPSIFYSPETTKYIIEVNAGYAEKNNLKVGSMIDAAKKAVNN